ncbi:MAG: hypothetical protein COC00_006945 [Rhizobiales bacterium]|nr:hypothetical protein [Hyphomicrobiales bacterium]
MLRLYILRHVCAKHTTPGQRDIDRTISESGAKSLIQIQNTLYQNNYNPKTIYCSPATRTRQTLAGIEDNFPASPNIMTPKKLYAGVTNDYFDIINEHENAETLMVIGHNPMCSDFVYSMCSTGTPQNLKKIVLGFGEGSLASIEFDIDHWSQLKQKSGHIIEFKDHSVLTGL